MKNLATLLLVCSVALVFGCGAPVETSDQPDDSAGHSHADHDHDHDHSAPHGGLLVDIGHDHEYHAEIVDDHDTDVVTIYILDGELKPVQVAQSSISVVLSTGDKSDTFEFKGEGDRCSEFKLKDDAMMTLLDTDGVKGVIRMTLEDKPYKGNFDFKHGHDHDHDH